MQIFRNKKESYVQESPQVTSLIFTEVLVEAADYCFSSMMFTSMVGLVTVLLIMSGKIRLMM